MSNNVLSATSNSINQDILDGYEENKPTLDEIESAKIRKDLMQRLFAVAISVGFAAAINKIPWIRDGTAFSQKDALNCSVIVTALYATVLSWDGYLLSISKKPLYDFTRFSLDIFLVFIYMFMLMTADRPYIWIYVLCLIFSLYVSWDFLTVRRHYNAYVSKNIEPRYIKIASFKQIMGVYTGGFRSITDVRFGPIATFVWATYFYAMAFLSLYSETYTNYKSCIFAIVGLYLYRRDKRGAWPGRSNGFGMLLRLLMITALLGTMFFIYFDVCGIVNTMKAHYADWLPLSAKEGNFALNT